MRLRYCLSLFVSVTGLLLPPALLLPAVATAREPSGQLAQVSASGMPRTRGSTEAFAPPAQASPSKADTGDKETSLAERIVRLQRTNEEDKQSLGKLEAKKEEHKTEFEKANEEFKQVDAQLEEQKKALKAAQEAGSPAAVENLRASLAELGKKWKLARERFNLAIEAKKTAEEQYEKFKVKIDRDEQASKKLLLPSEPPPTKKESTTAEPQPAPLAVVPASTIGSMQAAAGPAAESPPAGAESVPASAPSAEKPSVRVAQVPDKEAPPSEEVQKAQEEAAKKTAVAEKADGEVNDLNGRLKALDDLIAAEQKLHEAAQKRCENARASWQDLRDQYNRLKEQNAAPAELQAVTEKIFDVQKRWEEAKDEAQRLKDQLTKRKEERKRLNADLKKAERNAKEAGEDAQEANHNLESIQNPFSPKNLLRWLTVKGPQLFLILIAIFVLKLLIRVASKRIVAFLTRSDSDETNMEREKRISTLVGVFHNTSVLILYVGAILMTLQVLSIPIAPLLGGAAVVGLAVAFASQNLIKDYFCGFMILLENQYGVNDVVSVGGITGFVERITLRMTVIRDYDAVHFVPHGQITTVSNLTHKWSRAVFDIGVAYKENVDQVMDVLMQLGREIRQDPEFSWLILEDPEMLGVDEFGDSAVVIKFFIKTRPLKQWTIKREMLRRIKNKFDELGIEIPFPHHTVYHRCEAGEGIALQSSPGEGPKT